MSSIIVYGLIAACLAVGVANALPPSGVEVNNEATTAALKLSTYLKGEGPKPACRGAATTVRENRWPGGWTGRIHWSRGAGWR